MDRFVSPQVNQLKRLRDPLTPGEQKVFNLFNDSLDPKWEIYIQPHLNGLRPDFVLLHPEIGIAVFEVKDWNLRAMRYWAVERAGKSPKLLANDGKKTFSIQSQNPVDKVRRYKQEIHELYCPRLNGQASFACITAGVIFPFASEDEVQELLTPSLDFYGMLRFPQYNPISGFEAISANRIDLVFPDNRRAPSKYMSAQLADDLRNWLVEPDFAQEQRKPIELDATQRSFVTSRTHTGYRRIKGPAGSGKSLILAARAAQLVGEGKQVLVVTFNITLLHYLMDIAVRWPINSGNTRQSVTWLNFHAWCKRVCLDTDHELEYLNLWKTDDNPSGNSELVFEETMAALAGRCIDNDTDCLVTKFDAVLVDEGQDFRPSWWNTLRKVCLANGEMLLVADATQDVYETAHSWTDEAMTGAGFPGGRWAELKTSYRLPPAAAASARNFAKEYLPSDTVDLPFEPQGELDLFPCSLRWVQISPEEAIDACVNEILQMPPMVKNDILAITDITFLTGNQEIGAEVVNLLSSKGVNTVHTYSDDNQVSRKLKMGFYMGDARVKATTIHSFKGWEARAIVIFIGQKYDQKTCALIYAGLTRLKRHEKGSFLTVVSCSNALEEYGRSWKDYQDYTTMAFD